MDKHEVTLVIDHLLKSSKWMPSSICVGYIPIPINTHFNIKHITSHLKKKGMNLASLACPFSVLHFIYYRCHLALLNNCGKIRQWKTSKTFQYKTAPDNSASAHIKAWKVLHLDNGWNISCYQLLKWSSVLQTAVKPV